MGIRKQWKIHKYRKYIENHRDNIQKAYCEMVMCPGLNFVNWTEDLCYKLKERANNHDLSKYSEEEFEPYRKFYHPVNKEEKFLGEIEFDAAWEHHWSNNWHHWQCRQYCNNEMTEEIYLGCLENVMDWLAMSYKFGDRPYQFWEKNKDKIKLPQVQMDLIRDLVYGLEDNPKDKGYRI